MNKKVFLCATESTTSSNGFVNHIFSTARDIERTKHQVFNEYPDAVILDGEESWHSADHKRPEVFARKFKIDVIAYFHSGISGVTHSGIVISKESFETINNLYKETYGFDLASHITVWEKER